MFQSFVRQPIARPLIGDDLDVFSINKRLEKKPMRILPDLFRVAAGEFCSGASTQAITKIKQTKIVKTEIMRKFFIKLIF